MPGYVPGGRPLPSGPESAHKISANENPYPPLPGVLAVAVEAAASMNRYPDLRAARLVAAIARRLEVPPDHVVPGTGSVGVLAQVVQAVAGDGDEVVHAWRSFEAFPICVGVCGATGVRVPLDGDARHDLVAMARAVTSRTRLVLVCSPNNPTGPTVHSDELRSFLDDVPRDVLVVIDEAYREFVRDPEAPDGVEVYRERPNVVVLRTFSKAYGLAGLRVGYAVAHEPVAEALRKTAIPFGVSTIAQEAALASLDAQVALDNRVTTLVAERERVVAGLYAAGYEVPDAQGNFVWLPLGVRTADFVAACTSAGLAVRAFAGEGARCTIAEPEANDTLLRTCFAFGSRGDRELDHERRGVSARRPGGAPT